jgi:hypothetical protein
MKKFIFLLLILLSPVLGHAEPKLFSSDWPVWNLTEGMHKNGLLNSFDYRMEKYEICLKWFKAGNLDITFMTLYDFISIQPTKVPTVILGVTDYSNGGDKFIVRNSIKNAKDLKSKKILLSSNTISLWFLHNYLEAHGLRIDDVEVVDQEVTLAPLQFRDSPDFSGVVSWNPAINEALKTDSYIAATSADFPGVIYDLIVAKKSFVDENPDLVKAFLLDYYKSINNEDIINKTAQALSVTVKEYKSWLKDAYIFPTRTSANNQYKKLLDNSHKIIDFLTTAPKSLHNENAKSKFRPRKIDMKKLIYFKGSQ